MLSPTLNRLTMLKFDILQHGVLKVLLECSQEKTGSVNLYKTVPGFDVIFDELPTLDGLS